MKKVLSLVLVIAMVLSSMSFAFAGTFTDVTDNDYKKAIETLSALGVVKGYEDGTFKPEKVVTRAEMAKLIVEVLGYGNLVTGSKSNFADTQGHWADAWIALAAGKGLVVGTGNGKFTPDRTVSYDEVITMVVRAIGYTDTCNELKGMTWPTNFKVKAAELKLTKDVKLSSTGADRGGVAQLLANALEATLVTVNSDGDVVKSTTQTTDKDGKVVVEYTELLSRIATYDSAYEVDTDTLDKDSKNYGGNLVDLAPYMYQSIKAYLNDDDEVVFVKGTNSLVIDGTVTDVLDKDGKSFVDEEYTSIASGTAVKVVIEDANKKEHKVTVDSSIEAFYNGEEDAIAVKDFTKLLYEKGAAKITAIIEDKDKDGILDSTEAAKNLIVQKPTKGILVDTKYAEGKAKLIGKDANISLPTDDGDVDLASITVTGAVTALADIAVNDVVIEYASIDGSTVKLDVVRNVVSGTVKKTSTGATTIYVGDTSYSTSKVIGSVRYGEAIKVGDEGKFYLDNAGKIFAVDTDGEALTDYALVIGLANGEFSSNLDGSVKSYPQMKLLNQKNETVTYDVAVSVEKVEKDGTEKVVIDDSASYSNENDAKPVDADLVVCSGTNNIEFVPSTTVLNRGTLVRYSLDKSGDIDEIEIVKTATEKIDLDDIEKITSDNVVVFNSTTKDEEVSKTSNLIDNATHNVVYKDGKIIVIVTNKIESANDGVFGVINDIQYVKNADGDTVTEVTAFVEGKKVVYLTNDKIAIDTKGISFTTTASAYKFNFNTSDELTSVVDIKDGATNDKTETLTGLAASVSSSKITIGTETRYFTGDVAVYIYDKSDDEITIGDISDLDDGFQTRAYVVDTTATNRIGLVVQVQP